jgi:hypothetical protein
LSDLTIDPPHERWAGRFVVREEPATIAARPPAEKSTRFSRAGLVSLLGLSRRRSQAGAEEGGEEEEGGTGGVFAHHRALDPDEEGEEGGEEEGEGEEGGPPDGADSSTLCSWTIVDDADVTLPDAHVGRTGSIKKLWRRLSGANRK